MSENKTEADTPTERYFTVVYKLTDANVAKYLSNRDWITYIYTDSMAELASLKELTAQDPSQPGGFSAGDMASAAAQGFRGGWTAAQAISAEPAVQDVCEWDFDDEYEVVWESSCGELWSFIDGGPKENRVRFCHGCGKPVALAAHEKAKKP